MYVRFSACVHDYRAEFVILAVYLIFTTYRKFIIVWFYCNCRIQSKSGWHISDDNYESITADEAINANESIDDAVAIDAAEAINVAEEKDVTEIYLPVDRPEDVIQLNFEIEKNFEYFVSANVKFCFKISSTFLDPYEVVVLVLRL